MDTKQNTAENKMGIMQVDKLLINMSAPMMMSMLVQALYNIVDSIYVSKISEDALTSVSLCFPVQSLMIAVLVGTNIGVNSVLSRKLGEKNQKQVDKIANVAIFLAICCSILFMIIGLFASKPFINAQKVDEEIKIHAIEYMRIVCIYSMPLALLICMEKLLSSTGLTFYNMLTQMCGAIANIILDPIFIFKFGMGVKGAAIATVVGQSIGLILGIYLNLAKNKDIHIKFSLMRADFDIIRNIFSVGLPSIIMQSLGSFTLFAINMILIRFSSTAVAFFGIYFKLQSFVTLPMIGLANGLIPIVAYNYGAKKRDRVLLAMNTSFRYSAMIMLVSIIILQSFPEHLLKFFEASQDMIKIGVPAIKIISISYVFVCFSIIMSSVFQALGSGVSSMIVSLTRQMIFLLPIMYFLSLQGDINKIWFSFVIAELIAFFMCIVFLKIILKKLDFSR